MEVKNYDCASQKHLFHQIFKSLIQNTFFRNNIRIEKPRPHIKFNNFTINSIALPLRGNKMIIEATLTERRRRDNFFLLSVCGEHTRSKLISNPQSSNEKKD